MAPPPLAARSLAAASLALAASACAPTLGPAPKLTAPGDYATAQSFAAPAAGWPSDRWWTAYGDPQLDRLIESALASSPDLREAAARVRLAESQVAQAGARLGPNASLSGSVKETRITQSIGLPPVLPGGWNDNTQLQASLNWQLDFFGKNRAALDAALSQTRAARADQAAARLQLSSAVANAYASLLQLYADRDSSVEALKVRRQTLDLVGQRLRNGLETRGEFSQQSATVPAAQAEVDRLDLQILQTRHQLAALLGKGPDAGLDIARPATPTLQPLGLPANLAADLIGRRPDIVAARERVEVARQSEKSARADFYPNVNLAASDLVLSLRAADFTSHNIQLAQVGPAISLPLFDNGQRAGAYRGARADVELAVAEYDRAVTNALREVADAVAAKRSLTAQIVDARASLQSSEDAYQVARERYQGGLSPYLNVLTAENTVLQARRTVADLEAQALSLDLALIRALGGGFAAPAVAAASR